MTRTDQKDEELAAFERFRSTTGLLKGPVDQPHPPEPDIVFRQSGGEVEVELTELVAGPIQRGVESAHKRTLDRARVLFEAGGGPPCFVSLCWAHAAGPRRVSEQLAQTIADLVRGNIPGPNGRAVLDSSDDDAGPLGTPLLHRIDIARLDHQEM